MEFDTILEVSLYCTMCARSSQISPHTSQTQFGRYTPTRYTLYLDLY